MMDPTQNPLVLQLADRAECLELHDGVEWPFEYYIGTHSILLYNQRLWTYYCIRTIHRWYFLILKMYCLSDHQQFSSRFFHFVPRSACLSPIDRVFHPIISTMVGYNHSILLYMHGIPMICSSPQAQMCRLEHLLNWAAFCTNLGIFRDMSVFSGWKNGVSNVHFAKHKIWWDDILA